MKGNGVANRKKTVKKKEFKVKYVIPEHVRDVYINGAYGGVTPRSEISLHMYCERGPIPTSITHPIDNKGQILLGKEISREVGGDAVRLVQASVIMDVTTAVALRDWLDGRIKIIEEFKLKEADKKKEGQ